MLLIALSGFPRSAQGGDVIALQQFLLELWEQIHTTILMITHDIEEAIYLSQRVYVMSTYPGRLRREIVVNLPEQRDLEIKLSNQFVTIKRKIIHTLHEG